MNGLVARVVGFAAVVPLALLVAPLLTGQLIAERGLSPAQTGVYFLFELGGISLASLPAVWWMRRWSGGRIATVAALVFIAGNALSIVTAGYAALLAVRLVTAMAGGALMILSMNAAAASANRDRLFALWIGGQLVLAAIALTLLPRLFAAWGLGAYYAGMALVMALLLPLAPGFAVAQPERARGGGNGLVFPGVAMLAVLAFYVGLGGCWAFVSVIATRAGLGVQPVADRLALASLLGIAGASAAAALGGRASRRLVLPVGYALLIVAVVVLGLRLDIGRFAIAVYLFKFGWTFALPFVLGAIAARDRTGGSIMAAVNLVIGTGTSLGPVLTGLALERAGVVPMLACCVAAMAVSLGLVALIESGRLSGDAA